MFTQQIVNLKPKVQTIIDLIVKKDRVNAAFTWHDVAKEVDELLDVVVLDEHLIELGKYQALLQHLWLKISNDKQ
ncbi:hypothetical protein [Flavobacterium difficile]|uniref:Uncharacterized protein n=1 Tax=Flavobacterium difficile TaxID=2709659 RepID=A0ABX0I5R2_9FLAO|nr:hypothetical protein [Flavobacterium difficile]NHM02467.1 hypothetical protein [Flavobacterium difficile]